MKVSFRTQFLDEPSSKILGRNPHKAKSCLSLTELGSDILGLQLYQLDTEAKIIPMKLMCMLHRRIRDHSSKLSTSLIPFKFKIYL